MSIPIGGFSLPVGICSDSYKAGHFKMYPDAKKMVAYGELRSPWKKDETDSRFVFFGIRHFIETYLLRQWTEKEVENCDKFYSTHNTGSDGSFTPYPFPKDLFMKFVKENNGYFPVKVEALPEGTVAHIHVPLFIITATEEYSRLCTFLETTATHLWFPCNVATLSRRTRELIENAFEKSVDDEMNYLIESRLHDFGFRGTSGLEAAMIGGAAHLLNFRGSDTMAAAYYVQYALNNGKPVAQSIPATEHSVMTSWKSEKDAIENMIGQFGDGFFACVLDSYDYQNCLDDILPKVKAAKEAKKGYMVCRPDSGDPAEAVVAGLKAIEKVFGATTNKKGFKVINGAGVIQGDGVGYDAIKHVMEAVMAAGYSCASVAFGMGGGLLQKHNRDTMSMATKLCYIQTTNGEERDVMKYPKTDGGKVSLPGELEVKNVDGIPTIFPKGDGPKDTPDVLVTVYDNGPVKDLVWDDFDAVRARVDEQWRRLPKLYNPVSSELQAKIEKWVKANKERMAKELAEKK